MAPLDYKDYHPKSEVNSTPGAAARTAGMKAYPRPAMSERCRGGRCRRLALFLLAVFAILQGVGWWAAARMGEATAVELEGEKPKSAAALRAENAGLQKKIAALGPKGLYVVVDTAGNRVYLRNGDKTLREMVASCGSGNVLEDKVGGRTWTFETPRGAFKIQSKLKNPLWIKPDWAFLEEGESVPTDWSARAEPGMMGDYALGIGRGYFIHGTMYSRMLGRNVSHGCVRLGDQDLKHLVDQVSLGTPVLIF